MPKKSDDQIEEIVRKPTSLKDKSKMSLYVGIREVTRCLQGNRVLVVLIFQDSYFTNEDLSSNLPVEITSLLQVFADVFSEELPSGLPPLRGIEH